ncbi:MAG: chemotaxis protein CheC [Candidatus Bathyarchaeia archaeon]
MNDKSENKKDMQNKPIDLDILLELGSIGAGHAATSLSELLQEHVAIDVPKIHVLPPHLLPEFYNKHDAPTTAIYMQLAEADCDILLMFEVDEARKIAATMTMAPSTDEVDATMEASAIQELANILLGSFLSAISDFTGVNVVLTPPQRMVDSFDAILDHFVIKQSLISDEVLVFDIRLKRASSDAKSILMLFPGKELQLLLVQKSKEVLGLEVEERKGSEMFCPSPMHIAAISDSQSKMNTS